MVNETFATVVVSIFMLWLLAFALVYTQYPPEYQSWEWVLATMVVIPIAFLLLAYPPTLIAAICLLCFASGGGGRR